MDRLSEKYSEEQIKLINKVIGVFEITNNNGYMDWNDWNDWYEDPSEDGLEAYMCEEFGLEFTHDTNEE